MYLHQGGDPRVFDDLPMRDIAAWLSIHDILEARQSLGEVPKG